MKIVIIGGTGQIGSALAAKLRDRGHEVVAASPSTGVDALTGQGVAEALAGADAVVDVTNPPSFDTAHEFFTRSSANLVAAGRAAGVRHHVALSIVGTDRVPDSPYLVAKVAQEKVIQDSGVPWTIVRATQFDTFLPVIADLSTTGDEIRLTDATLQPIRADHVSTALADVVEAEPAGTVEIAGPEAVGLDELVRRTLKDGDPRRVVTDHAAGYFGAVIEDGSLTPGPGARIMG